MKNVKCRGRGTKLHPGSDRSGAASCTHANQWAGDHRQTCGVRMAVWLIVLRTGEGAEAFLSIDSMPVFLRMTLVMPTSLWAMHLVAGLAGQA